MVLNEENKWYALHVKTTAERAVANALHRFNIQHFLPIYKTPYVRKKSTFIEKPLFPGYVFCNMDLATGPKLYHIPGLIGIVKRGKNAISIDQYEIERIRSMVDSGSFVTPYPFLKHGDEVIVITGPLRGLKGFYVNNDKSSHLIVSFPLLQRSVRVRICSEWVERTHSSHAYCA